MFEQRRGHAEGHERKEEIVLAERVKDRDPAAQKGCIPRMLGGYAHLDIHPPLLRERPVNVPKDRQARVDLR